MDIGFLAFAAMIPISVALFMNYVQPRERVLGIPTACLITIIVAMGIWGISFHQVFTSVIQGLLISLQLILLLISVIFCMESLRATQTFSAMSRLFSAIHPDRRVQALVVAWFFNAFVDSLFGFASSAGICTLLLYSSGFPPACAIMLSVLGLMTCNSFSTGGAPILFGVANGLNQPRFLENLTASGMNMETYLQLITSQVGIFQAILGAFLPVIMILFMCRFFGRRQTWSEGLSFAPFALLCGIAFSAPYAYTAIHLGARFPSMAGSVIGLALILTLIRFKIFLPKQAWDFLPTSEWPRTWTGGPYQSPPPPAAIPIGLLMMPFALLAGFSILTHWTSLRLTSFFQTHASMTIDMFQNSFQIFAPSPYFLFYSFFLIAVGGINMLAHRFDGFRDTFSQRLLAPASHAVLNLPFIMPMICLYLHSEINPKAYPGMFRSMAEWLAQLPGAPYWGAFLSPFLGAASTYFSLNNIYGNLTLSTFQNNLGSALLSQGSVLWVSLQVIGASAGCMIATHYLMGSSISIPKTEVAGPTGRKTLLAMLAYLFAAGVLGVTVAHVL
ncbi:MAG: L-lactate permease [Verrucomicrobiota bacterium]